MSVSVLLTQVFIIMLQIGLGFVAGKTGIVNDEGSKTLSNIIMFVALPCTLIAATNFSASGEVLLTMLAGFGLLLLLYIICGFICVFLAKRMKLTKGQTAVFVSVTVLPNSAFIGIPLVTAILGETQGMLYAATGVMAYNLYFFTYVYSLFKSGEKFSIKNFITVPNITTVIMIIMLIVNVQLPSPLQSFVATVGSCTTPLALMVVGVMLSKSNIKALLCNKLLYLITFLRCLVFPLVFLLLLSIANLDATMAMGIVILAACPSGSLGAVLAKQVNVEPEFASEAVAHSTMFIVVTVPFILLLADKLLV